MKAPGRKTVVRTAMTFIAELSCLLATVSSLESPATEIFKALSSWAIWLNSCECELPIFAVSRIIQIAHHILLCLEPALDPSVISHVLQRTLHNLRPF